MTRDGQALPAPRQARSQLPAGRLMDAAAELIAEGGYERMTLVAIGERAGYSHDSVMPWNSWRMCPKPTATG